MKKTIGLKRGIVELTPYNPVWAKSFDNERKRLSKILNGKYVAIEHVGSTAVPGISAKPVIDIAVGIPSIKKGKFLINLLEKNGYFYRPNFMRPDQRLVFSKGNEKTRTHYIHVIRYNGIVWKKLLVFKNYLLTHSARSKQYNALKSNLAKRFSDDRKAYTAHKKAFIVETLKMARFNK